MSILFNEIINKSPTLKYCEEKTSTLRWNEIAAINLGEKKYVKIYDKVVKISYLLDAKLCVELSFETKSSYVPYKRFNYGEVITNGGLIEQSNQVPY